MTAIKAAKHVRVAKVSKAITHFLGFQLMTDPSLMVKRIRFETLNMNNKMCTSKVRDWH